ncbi:hypothetical protein F0562_014319 [Nyssa sinensis]|uniref:Uncharacterized protein n=1 Tax=Nyssa sinensis TaxID=561372 RepID=A0A5J4ZMI0_9ASTE|nr:hypothetical protein F0562_014319 [Nyssa sinensis]
MKISDGAHSPANFPPIISPNSPPDLNSYLIAEPELQRRRTGKAVVVVTGTRRKKQAPPLGRRSGLETPLLRWKFDDRDLSVAGDDAPASGSRVFRRRRSEAVVSVSARKLAAGLWQLAAEVTCGGVDGGKGSQCGSLGGVGFEPGIGHVKINPKTGTFCKLQSSLPFPKSVMEGATKWDPGYSKTSNQVYGFYSHMKLLENQPVATVSVVSALQAELVHARTRIHELETAQHSSKKKFEHYLKKIH